MDDDENVYNGDEKETKKKHKKSRHRDEERRNKNRDEDDEERRERRRERRSKRGEDGGQGEDENEEERRRRKKKESEKTKHRDDESRDGAVDDQEKHGHRRTTKEAPEESGRPPQQTEDVLEKRSEFAIEQSTEDSSTNNKKSKAKSSSKTPADDDDDESLFKIMKPSRAVVKAEDGDKKAQEPKPFVNIWELAIKKQEEKELLTKEEREEKTILFLGGKSAGKSSVILRYLERASETPKPTVALDYSYCRRAKENSYETKTAHLWELGGGLQMSNLIESVIDKGSIGCMRVALVIDLSMPKYLWTTLERWLDILKKRVEDVLKEMKDGKAARDKLETKAKQRIREGHPDLEMMDLFPLPIVIIGTKFDIFQNFESEERKIICKTLRFISHRIGANLQFSGINQEVAKSRVRSIILNFLFDVPLSISNQVAHNKLVTVAAGTDSFQDIGLPPVATSDAGRFGAKTPIDLWKYAFTKHFPQEDATHSSMEHDPTKDPQYKDLEIDALIAQKEMELSRFAKTLDAKEIDFDFSIFDGFKF